MHCLNQMATSNPLNRVADVNVKQLNPQRWKKTLQDFAALEVERVRKQDKIECARGRYASISHMPGQILKGQESKDTGEAIITYYTYNDGDQSDEQVAADCDPRYMIPPPANYNNPNRLSRGCTFTREEAKDLQLCKEIPDAIKGMKNGETKIKGLGVRFRPERRRFIKFGKEENGKPIINFGQFYEDDGEKIEKKGYGTMNLTVQEFKNFMTILPKLIEKVEQTEINKYETPNLETLTHELQDMLTTKGPGALADMLKDNAEAWVHFESDKEQFLKHAETVLQDNPEPYIANLIRKPTVTRLADKLTLGHLRHMLTTHISNPVVIGPVLEETMEMMASMPKPPKRRPRKKAQKANEIQRQDSRPDSPEVVGPSTQPISP